MVIRMNEEKLLAEDLSRASLYGLTKEYILALMLKCKHSTERKALVQLFALLYFVQGKRRFPRKDELYIYLSEVLDRNLGISDLNIKWQLELGTDPSVDDPEKFFLETLEMLETFHQLQEGWSKWMDGA